MNLKEAGRYANHLNRLLMSLEAMLVSDVNLFVVTEHHYRNKVNSEQQDDVVKPVVERTIPEEGKAQDVAHLIAKVIDEKLQLALAIEEAKRKTTIGWKENGRALTIDAGVEYNKRCRELAESYLQRLLNRKSTVRKRAGKGSSQTAEKAWVSYEYEIEVTSELDFDRNVVRDLYQQLLKKTDRISTLLDEAMLKDTVRFEPAYDIHVGAEEVVAAYLKSVTKTAK